MAIYDGQHLVPMIFSIKSDGRYKARLVGWGDLMIAWIDFNPKEIYCGFISACGIKLVLTIAASYKLRLRGGDLVGAYLVTRANKEKWFLFFMYNHFILPTIYQLRNSLILDVNFKRNYLVQYNFFCFNWTMHISFNIL